MHGLLPAKVRRRTQSLAAAFAVLAALITAGLTLAQPARAAPGPAGAGRVSVTVDAMNPQVARPGSRITVTGTIGNSTGQAQAGLEIQLYTSAQPFQTRDGMGAYLVHGMDGQEPAGQPFVFPASVAPGATASWTASFTVTSAGITQFGVYPVTAQLQDAYGDQLSAGHTLLPFWPGQRTAGLRRPLQISWLWPLVDQPHRQACSALTNNDLAASLRPGGHLAGLLAAGAGHPGAGLTWVIDPALAGDVATMTRPYRVGGRPNCTGTTREPASAAAADWLAALRKVTPTQPTVITPYADVDMTALVHQGLTGDLAAAYRTGDTVADSVLKGKFGHSVAWPAGGTADLSVLTNLATAEHVTTVVLDSREMPSSDPADDAVTSLTVAGLPMTVLLSDATLTSVLKAAGTGSGPLPEAAAFAVRQRFLAETAMIAAEYPGSARTIVVAPPAGWNPSQAIAGDLLGETETAPWLTPARLDRLSAAPDTRRTAARQAPPASKASPGELGPAYLDQARSLGGRLGVYESMLYQPPPGYVPSLNEALAATESVAWRGGGQARGLALLRGLADYLGGAEDKVKIITSAQVPMGGSSGAVPVSVLNELGEAVQVRVVASVASAPDRISQLTVGPFQSLVVIYPQQSKTVRLPLSSAPPGSTVIQLGLVSAHGTPLPFAHASLTVVSTRYGRAILVLIAAAIGVLVLTSAYRGLRGWRHDDEHVVSEQEGLPGSVVGGTSDARHPTEAPDDLADARRRADDA